MASILEKMGMYGLQSQEDFLLAGMLTGDPVLLIGTHGSGKTYFCELVAKVLGVDYQCYDASKAMFEDTLGFPNPKSLVQGSVDYIPTPMSILPKEFVLIDEISRAHVQMQNKWLEIIRSRQIMGVKCRRLRWVWAAMNPLSYEGAVPLDEALAGRFSLIIIMPEAKDMEDADALSVVMSENGDDALAISSWGGMKNERPSLPTKDLKELLAHAGSCYNSIVKEKSAAISTYTVRLMRALSEKGVTNLDGRRLGMIRRNIMSVLAIRRAKNSIENVEKTVKETILKSLPNIATGHEISATDVLTAHNLVKASLNAKQDVNYTIMIERDMSRKIFLAMNNAKHVNPNTMKDIVQALVSEDEYLPVAIALAPILLKFPHHFDIETVTQVSRCVAELSGPEQFNFILDKGSVLALEDFMAIEAEFKKTTVGIMALRLAAHLSSMSDNQDLISFNNIAHDCKEKIEHAISRFRPLYEAMKAGTYTA